MPGSGTLGPLLGALVSSKAASSDVLAHAPQLAGSHLVRTSSSALCMRHSLGHGEMGWAGGTVLGMPGCSAEAQHPVWAT